MRRIEELRKYVDRLAIRIRKAEHERETLLGLIIYIGTLCLLLVLPIIGGAYFGHWLDSIMQGYSIRWTVSMIFIGLVTGAINVYVFIKD